MVEDEADTREALEVFERLLPDVLVSDISMPGEDGYALIEKVRALSPERGGEVPALALTAFARPEDRVRALSVGFQLHVSKPVEIVDLLSAIATLARRGAPSRASGEAGSGQFEPAPGQTML